MVFVRIPSGEHFVIGRVVAKQLSDASCVIYIILLMILLLLLIVVLLLLLLLQVLLKSRITFYSNFFYKVPHVQ